MTPDELKDFREWNVPLPTRDPHGTDSTDNPIGSNLKKLQLRNWRLKGNKLMADSDMGEYAYLIPPDRILTGTDEQGLPILKKIVI